MSRQAARSQVIRVRELSESGARGRGRGVGEGSCICGIILAMRGHRNLPTLASISIGTAVLILTACIPATKLPTPTYAAPSSTAAASVTPLSTATPSHGTVLQPSKYAGISVHTIEEQANDRRSLLHAAYPVTERTAINARLEALASAFIGEYRSVADAQEASYQDYLRETGMEAASFATHYVQHFDITAADATLISVAIEQYRSTGGTGSTQVTGYLFDRVADRELEPGDLFVDDTYLQRLSALTRTELERLARERAALLEVGDESARTAWLESQISMIQAGTEPMPENFDSVLFREDGTFEVLFDKYQVGPGADGVVTISLPYDGIADLLVSEMQLLLDIEPATPTPTPEPPPTTTPMPPSGGDHPSGNVDCSQVSCVALTFDDGPSVYTGGLLDQLAAHNARATFFVLGKSARVQPETIARFIQEGHEIGNHSWSHLDLSKLGDDEIRQEINQTNEVVAQITGTSPKHFRPPYGAYNDHVLSVTGLPVVLWSLDPLDWKDRDAEIVAQRMREAQAGAIILAHDIHRTTVDAIPAVLTAFESQGVHFVTVSQLFAPEPLSPGHVYTRQRVASHSR